ncbi:gp197 [Bacillus phage G]|uniref:Gp197 n=1 Tax=Bacillus phage G TaxID=2884420 RepID=G3MBR3_9CAUD|nr:gp197 [Bacillus phage G]AEO93457.1 gp197 [Bacillus phage G]
MLTKFVIIGLNDGLTSETVVDFLNLTNEFTSSIILNKRGHEANAKNMMELLALSVRKTEELTIQIDGIDQVEAIEAIYKFLSNE